eukprot:2275116-Prymnesium_polylepis.1
MRHARALAAICHSPPHGTPLIHPCYYNPIVQCDPAARRRVPGCSRGYAYVYSVEPSKPSACVIHDEGSAMVAGLRHAAYAIGQCAIEVYDTLDQCAATARRVLWRALLHRQVPELHH